MPSWNIHIALVQDVLSNGAAARLGIEDANAFLFGNCVPDVYVGFMVPDASFRIDYCITHFAQPCMIPLPNADLFWDMYIARHPPETPAGMSLALGAWAHVLADRFFNGRFRTFWLTHDAPGGDEQRICKQADFELFGQSLALSSEIQVTSELFEAARDFHQYRIVEADVRRVIEAANRIVGQNGTTLQGDERYRLLDEAWMRASFNACVERIGLWLATWQDLKRDELPHASADIRKRVGIPPARLDDPDWMQGRKRNAE